MKKILYLILGVGISLSGFLCGLPQAFAQETITGTVISAEDGTPLPGANVTIKGGNQGTNTDENGRFILYVAGEEVVLTASSIGYQALDTPLQVPLQKPLIISLSRDAVMLEEVMVSTGYQTLPKERATGSFVQIDNELLNRRVGTNILDRLDGVTSGLIFDKNQQGNNQAIASIRGRSTIFADPNPLIVLDNFPYEGDLGLINPNDIESITILKDAAAASIWGTRAGNGVIIITTRKGNYSNETRVNFNSNITISEKPKLYYHPYLNSAEYIELEKFLFDQGYYNSDIEDGYSNISQAVELFQQLRNGQISEKQATSQLDILRKTDVRKALSKYFYRNAVNQQYSLNISGGGKRNKYYISGGYDKNLANDIVDSHQRFTLTANNTYNWFNNKLQMSVGIRLARSKSRGSSQSYSPLSPYDKVADNEGNALPVPSGGGLRKEYTDTAGAGRLLDWNYRPLKDIYANVTSTHSRSALNMDVKYALTPDLTISALYQYQKQSTKQEVNNRSDSYYVRDLVNQFTQIDYETGSILRPFPIGNILQHSLTDFQANYGRVQVSYSEEIFPEIELNAIAGIEARDNNSLGNTYTLFGYDPETANNANSLMDFVSEFPLFYNSDITARMPAGTSGSGRVNRYLSYYGNASFSLQNKYIVSLSARKDESNLFGVKSNQKGVPLWSAGLAWNLHSENFYSLDRINYLWLRFTFGYAGNVDKTTSAFLTARTGVARNGFNQWGAPYTEVVNPPNPSLRWERVQKINLGVDFEILNGLLSGSVEYFQHKGIDLIGNGPVAPQTGITAFRGNSATTETNGIDVIFSAANLSSRNVRWNSRLLLSLSRDKVIDYKVNQGANRHIVSSNYQNPLEGYPYNSVFSFRWAGLDAAGNPQGYYEGEISSDYNAIRNLLNPAELVYSGPGTPTLFGSLLNDLRWKNFGLSVNVTYKFNYYFRQPDVFNGSSYSFRQRGYENRWKQAGDEQLTYIPSLSYPANSSRGNFFQYSQILVESGDHIRLQDVRVSYQLRNKKLGNLRLSDFSIYAYANNLGVLWKANKAGIDPDFVSGYPRPRTFSIGVKVAF